MIDSLLRHLPGFAVDVFRLCVWLVILAVVFVPLERWFAYMPFEHAENAAMQEKSVALFTALAQQYEGFEGTLDYAHRHRGVIARFGRFPHRNAILGRASTPQELAYLSQPGSGF